MSFFYENIINWLRKESDEIGDQQSRLEWLRLVRNAVEQLINEIED